jgi:site-specific DNA-methyltransferase (adenine-specific)
MGIYQVIYADPPWSYRDKCKAGRRGVEFKYPTLSHNDIAALPVEELSANDALLFLWVTWPMLFEAQRVIRAWGFEYKTLAWVWVKLSQKGKRYHWGMGNWTRANSEPCLLAVKGRPHRISASVLSIIEAPVRAHSQKPNEAYGLIERLVGDVPRVELFARQKWPGWHSWGNEVDSDIDLLKGV